MCTSGGFGCHKVSNLRTAANARLDDSNEEIFDTESCELRVDNCQTRSAYRHGQIAVPSRRLAKS
jgi:hypothetical protein